MSPAFSPQLHARIMRAVKSSSAGNVEMRRMNARRYRINWPLLAIVFPGMAALIVVAASILFLWYPARVPVNTGVARMPSLPPIRNPVASLSGPVASSLADARFAYLDRDARNVMHYMAGQMDVLPASR